VCSTRHSLVSAIEPSERATRLPLSPSLAVTNDGADLRTVLVAVIVTPCKDRAELILEPLAEGIQVTLEVEVEEAGCDSISPDDIWPGLVFTTS